VNPDKFVEVIEREPRPQPSNVENKNRYAAFWAIGIFEDGLAGRLLKQLVEIVFPLLGAFTGFIFARSTLLVRAIVGAAWGFSYLVAGNLAISATIIGTFSLFFAVLLPIVFCELLGNFLRSETDKLHSAAHRPHIPKIGPCGD
jgi:lipopolysaccharide export LptBFGC system permease protein LptF